MRRAGAVNSNRFDCWKRFPQALVPSQSLITDTARAVVVVLEYYGGLVVRKFCAEQLSRHFVCMKLSLQDLKYHLKGCGMGNG